MHKTNVFLLILEFEKVIDPMHAAVVPFRRVKKRQVNYIG